MVFLVCHVCHSPSLCLTSKAILDGRLISSTSCSAASNLLCGQSRSLTQLWTYPGHDSHIHIVLKSKDIHLDDTIKQNRAKTEREREVCESNPQNVNLRNITKLDEHTTKHRPITTSHRITSQKNSSNSVRVLFRLHVLVVIIIILRRVVVLRRVVQDRLLLVLVRVLVRRVTTALLRGLRRHLALRGGTGLGLGLRLGLGLGLGLGFPLPLPLPLPGTSTRTSRAC